MDITLAQAYEGYFIHAEARSLSLNTIKDYGNAFRRFLDFMGDVPVAGIEKQDIERFMGSLDGLKKKTKLNYHTGLSALWTWMVNDDLVAVHVVRQVMRPKPEIKAIVPFSEQDIRLMLASLSRSRNYVRPGQVEPCSHRVPNVARNRAIILVLLDTGIRVTELCKMKKIDADLRNKRLNIFGKGAKGRMTPISGQTAKAIWRYLATRRDAIDHELLNNDPLFASSKTGAHLGRNSVRMLLQRVGRRAGVEDVYPHRFRHTFAIMYLRNQGDPFTLQQILGHSDMTMVRRYLELAKEDIERAHRSASPVANWNVG